MVHVFLRNAQKTPVPLAYQDGLIFDVLADSSRTTVDTGLERLVEQVGFPSQPALDFLLLSVADLAADKKAPRSSAGDRWTRAFDLSIPVSASTSWTTATPMLTESLEFLTGDRWTLAWRDEQNALWGIPSSTRAPFDAVSLFSGGLDSLVGAIDLLEENAALRVLLVGHYDSTLTPSVQATLANELRQHYGGNRVRLVQIQVRQLRVGGRIRVTLFLPGESQRLAADP